MAVRDDGSDQGSVAGGILDHALGVSADTTPTAIMAAERIVEAIRSPTRGIAVLVRRGGRRR